MTKYQVHLWNGVDFCSSLGCIYFNMLFATCFRTASAWWHPVWLILSRFSYLWQKLRNSPGWIMCLYRYFLRGLLEKYSMNQNAHKNPFKASFFSCMVGKRSWMQTAWCLALRLWANLLRFYETHKNRTSDFRAISWIYDLGACVYSLVIKI